MSVKWEVSLRVKWRLQDDAQLVDWWRLGHGLRLAIHAAPFGAMHQYLFRIEECADVFAEGTSIEEKFYSPWRSDPRPLRMTLHGAFVFTAVANMYLWERADLDLGIDRSECQRRAFFRAKQVEAALRIVTKHTKLSKVASIVLDAITDDIADILSNAKPDAQHVCEIEDGLRAHSDRYPNFVR